MRASEPPVVSVVIPAYRTAATLEAAVNSVLHQSFSAFEIIIVEDCSGDATLAEAQRLAATDERIEVVALERNGGQGNARNVGFDRARGQWIAILDADDVYLPDRLRALIQAGEDQAADFVADNQKHVDGIAGVFVSYAFPPAESGRLLTLRDFIETNSTQSSFSLGILKPMFRASFLREHSLRYNPELRLAEDFYFLMEIFAANGRGYLLNQAHYVWTLPFGPVSLAWTTTGLGAWRYDYRGLIEQNRLFITRMQSAGQGELVSLLQRREKEYKVMLHYIGAQKTFAESHSLLKATLKILRHPSTWQLLIKRVNGRLRRRLFGQIRASAPVPTATSSGLVT